ncbi:MAG: DNA repair protein RecO [Clostridia bacterium]|nr:DNA repair protein RecO [Clostridia bacterium]
MEGRWTGRSVKTEAVVLRSIKYGEADVILTLFGRNTGKIGAIAKGVKKPKSRMRGTVQLFSFGDYMLYRGKSLYTVTQCETKEPFSILREDLVKLTYASYIAEILMGLLQEEEVNPPVFNLMLVVMYMLSREYGTLAVRLFDLKMLKLAGYEPGLLSCVLCQGPLGQGVKFSNMDGGVVCVRCAARTAQGQKVSKGTLAIMNHLITENNLSKLDRLKISHNAHMEMENILHSYWQYILERRLKSISFLKDIRILHENQ